MVPGQDISRHQIEIALEDRLYLVLIILIVSIFLEEIERQRQTLFYKLNRGVSVLLTPRSPGSSIIYVRVTYVSTRWINAHQQTQVVLRRSCQNSST